MNLARSLTTLVPVQMHMSSEFPLDVVRVPSRTHFLVYMSTPSHISTHSLQVPGLSVSFAGLSSGRYTRNQRHCRKLGEPHEPLSRRQAVSLAR